MYPILKRILVGREDRRTIAKQATGADRFLGLGLVVSAALLGMALTRPLLQTDGYLGLSGSYSLIDAMAGLLQGGHGTAAVLILVAVILIPILLLSTAFDLWYKHDLHGDRFEGRARRLKQYNRLWFVSVGVLLFGLYAVLTAGEGTVLLSPVYYLILSVMILKLDLVRMGRLIDAVRFVEEEEEGD